MYYSCAPLKWLVNRPRSLLLPSLMAGSVRWRGRKSSTLPLSETLSPWCTLVECMITPESLLSGYEPLLNTPVSKLKAIKLCIFLIMSNKFMHCKFPCFHNKKRQLYIILVVQKDFPPVILLIQRGITL